jgi:uncharacterized protein (TIGR00730 family)
VSAIAVFCASSVSLDHQWLTLAREVGAGLAARGHTLVYGGGRVGMMGTVAVGARSGGVATLGVIPAAMFSVEVPDPEAHELITTADMVSRKTVMMEKADAFLVLPGGLGTLDELLEVWTTASLDLHAKPVVLLNHNGFYTGFLEWLGSLVSPHFVRAEAMDTLIVVNSVAAAVDAVSR